MRTLISKHGQKGHSLLEAIVATGVFIMVAIALSSVWVMYGKGLAKSGEVLAANNLARSVSEGIAAKGWDFLVSADGGLDTGTVQTLATDFKVVREVRGRQADIKFNVTYVVVINTPNSAGTEGRVMKPLFFSDDLARITVNVRWNSGAGGSSTSDPNYNNEIEYSTIVYKQAL